MKNVVITNVPKVPAETLRRLESLGVSTVHEAAGRVGSLRPSIRSVWQGARAAGSAVTVLAQPGDNWMLHVAVEQCGPGDLLVVGTTTDNDDGMFGELLATSLVSRGVRGLVIDAGVRDVAALRDMGFPVWSRAVNPRGTVKATLGSVNVPVVVAGQIVHPGDAVVADDDGVVVIPARDAQVVAEAGEAREANEAEKRAKLAAGVLGLDLYDMRDKLRNAGLVYMEYAADRS